MVYNLPTGVIKLMTPRTWSVHTQKNNHLWTKCLFKMKDPHYPETWKKISKVLWQSWTDHISSVQFSRSVMSNSATPWIAARQASLSITNSRCSLRLMSIESVMPNSHLILGRPLLLLPPIPPSIKVFSNESALHMRWPKYWSFSFSIIPSSIRYTLGCYLIN